MPITAVISGSAAGNASERMAEDLLAALFSRKAGLYVLMIPHLYHVPENDRRIRQELSGIAGPVVFVSRLHPRPAEWLLRRRVSGPLLALDLRAYASPEECFSAFRQSEFARTHGEQTCVQGCVREIGVDTAERWYPVIDYSRCVTCKQCSQFCLFGVYEVDDAGKVAVAQPDNCKPGCPACSRICPQGAIMFPLHSDHAIAGAPGKVMSPDPAAKAMFYARTKRRCPVCGSEFAAGQAKPDANNVCPECGRQTADGRPAPGGRYASGAKGDLDSLIDDLEQLR